MGADVILVIVVATALAFDFTNGFHDTANVAATAISTRAIAPKPAVALASLLNFAGAFISLKVAATVGKGFVDIHAVSTTIVFAGLVGAIAWNLITWWWGLPSSSSHALIGGLVGSVWAAHGASAVSGNGLLAKLIVPAIVAPLVAFLVAGIAILCVYRIVGRLRPGPVSRGFRLGQLASSGLLALSHGTNDAQKTMGLITLALVAHGDIAAKSFNVPTWVVVAAATAICIPPPPGNGKSSDEATAPAVFCPTRTARCASRSAAAVTSDAEAEPPLINTAMGSWRACSRPPASSNVWCPRWSSSCTGSRSTSAGAAARSAPWPTSSRSTRRTPMPSCRGSGSRCSRRR
jgi:hypothetical protein